MPAMRTNVPVPLTRRERVLQILLRINGVVMSMAVLAVFMPLEWMNRTHRYLGMGEAPKAPIFEYLARTISFLYFVHGMLCLLLSSNVRRFGPIITYLAVVGLIFAGLVFWIDKQAGLPPFWTLSEGPGIAVVSAMTLILRLASNEREESY